jgi:hypothetical protein
MLTTMLHGLLLVQPLDAFECPRPRLYKGVRSSTHKRNLVETAAAADAQHTLVVALQLLLRTC